MVNMKHQTGSDLEVFRAVIGRLPEIGEMPLPPKRNEIIKRWCGLCYPYIAEQTKKHIKLAKVLLSDRV
jgi:hypothetical protein